MNLRPYQQKAHAAAMTHLRHSLQPIVIEAATGAGKSHVIAALAESLRTISGGKSVLCLAPSKELVVQDAAKYQLTGEPYSLYSASVGQKDLSYPVVFGSPLSVLNSIGDFKGRFCAVIIDEAAGLTPTVKSIVLNLRADNPHLRVVGLTATPYRLGEGYIYRQHNGRAYGEDKARDPWFARCIYRIGARDLIDQGYLCPPVIGATGDCYDTSKLELNRMHKFDAEDIDRAFVGHGRLTATIMGEVVEKSRERQGVMIFAASVAHAEECLASLPPGNSAIVTGKTKPKVRAELLRRFLARELKYLVNVSVLTIGFDAPHVDLIAILRATESVGLLQQVVGRGLRMSPGKKDALILDYAQNIERHCPDGDIFDPEIKAKPIRGEAVLIDVPCPVCKTINEFSLNKEYERYSRNDEGYCLDLNGAVVQTDYGPLPAHYGRRCQHVDYSGVRCNYRWTEKACPKCKHANDISARKCEECGAELSDPNKKLIRKERALLRDPTKIRTEKVLRAIRHTGVSKKGNKYLAVDFITEGNRFRVYYFPNAFNDSLKKRYRAFIDAGPLRTVTYRKQQGTGFYETIAFNQPENKRT